MHYNFRWQIPVVQVLCNPDDIHGLYYVNTVMLLKIEPCQTMNIWLHVISYSGTCWKHFVFGWARAAHRFFIAIVVMRSSVHR